MCVKHLVQVQMGEVKSDPSDRKVPSLLGQVTLGKSHNFLELRPFIKWNYEYPAFPEWQ